MESGASRVAFPGTIAGSVGEESGIPSLLTRGNRNRMGSSQPRTFHDITPGNPSLRSPATLDLPEELVVVESFLQEALNHVVEALSLALDGLQ
jgi:hypothetical protein